MNVDVLNKEQRHKAMSHIKSKDTSIEVALSIISHSIINLFFTFQAK